MLELGPGLRAVEIESPFDIQIHTVHGKADILAGQSLAIRADAKRWSYVVSFPAKGDAFHATDPEPTMGWLTRVDAELVSGNAALAYISDDLAQISGEVTLTRGRHHVDLLLEHPATIAGVMARCGETSGMDLRVHGFACYRLIEDGSPLSPAPADIALRPVAHWSRFYGEPSGALPERVRYLRFRQLTEPRLMEWLEGLQILVTPGEQMSQAVFVSGLYEPCTATVLRRISREGDTFIDVGANVGLFTMLASRWVGPSGHVLAFEPSQREFKRLSYHISHNSLRNVQALPMAVGDRGGTAVLHVADPRYSGLNTLEEAFVYPDIMEAHTETVAVVRIDEFVALHSVPKVHVMKVDVEGGEHHVIEGARETIARDRPVLVLEVAGAALAAGHAGRTSVETFLQSLGYAFVAIDADHGTLRPVADLTAPSENFVAAPRDVAAGLIRSATESNPS